MPANRNDTPARSSVIEWLPWLAGAAGLLLYLATLNRWYSLRGLDVFGWSFGHFWQPQLRQPLAALVSELLRLVPGAWRPLALNLLGVLGASLALTLLARSVWLLICQSARDVTPHRDELHGVSAWWTPPLLAVVLCGLQLSFWEEATASTGEMINLVIAACVIRGLLEFRNDQNQKWLSQSAFLIGAGMANDWALVGYLPVYLLAVVLIKGLDLLELRFLSRMALWAAAGLGFYLVPPVLNWISGGEDAGFWQTLRNELVFQKQLLWSIPRAGFTLLGLSAFLPFLVIAFRGRLRVGYESRFGRLFVTTLIQFFFVLVLLVACWMALDPWFSPRGLGLGVPLLVYYYGWALAAGFCAGQLLLNSAASSGASKRTRRGSDPLKIFAGWPIAGLPVLCAVMVAGLLWRNLHQVRATNGTELRSLSRELYAGLPTGNSVVLSDDLSELLLLQAELSEHGHEKDPILLHPAWLASERYQRRRASDYKARWPNARSVEGFRLMKPIPLVAGLSVHEPVMYLHPSFGYFFEVFTDKPMGLVHRLAPRAPLEGARPALSPADLPVNEKYWQEQWTNSLQLLASRRSRQIAGADNERSWLAGHLKLPTRVNRTAEYISAIYSRALDDWGVRLRRSGQSPAAQAWFQRAIDLNPENLSARINLEYALYPEDRGEHRSVLDRIEKGYPDLVGRHRTWQEVLASYGPVDEPAFLLESGRTWQAGGNFWQASGDFERYLAMRPGDLQALLGLAECKIALRDFAAAVDLTDRARTSNPAGDVTGQSEISRVRTIALRGLGRTNEADAANGYPQRNENKKLESK